MSRIQMKSSLPSLLRQSGEAEGGVVSQQQNAGEAAHKQSKDGVFFPERQSKCKREGNQGQDAVVCSFHYKYLLKNMTCRGKE